MSSAAAWSYTGKATLWPLLGRDQWTDAATWGAPEVFACDYSAEAKTMRDDAGDEFTTRQVIYTERADIKRGDRVLIGISAVADPLQVDAREVRAVTRYGDTFERRADDYVIGTV